MGFLLSLLIGCSSFALAAEPADVLLLHGHIYTANPKQRWVEALAIRGDHIAAAGTNAEMESYRGKSTQVVDLAGRMAMPGIIDDHTHFQWASAGLAGLQIYSARTVPEVKQMLKELRSGSSQRSVRLWGGMGVRLLSSHRSAHKRNTRRVFS